jgi:DNA-binding transcriptional MerR regulator
MRIGEVAKLAETTPRTIRYYEEIGLLPSPDGRQPGAHRTYRSEDVERLTELLRLKQLLGISLEELSRLADVEGARGALRREWHEGVEDPVRRRQILDESLALLNEQLGMVRGRRDQIATLEGELLGRRRRVRDRLRELERGTEREPSRA